MIQSTRIEVAQKVRDAINALPTFEGLTLEVEEQGIYANEVGGQTWWRVPVLPHPAPYRMSRLYEALAEIEGYLQEEQNLDILLFVSDFEEVKAVGSL
ncbi:MAG: hypothetical protein H7308_11500 [Chthonomonadaceae bacterium]|nr:hypothetical protein [Chthonomonadaceae bacterium]